MAVTDLITLVNNALGDAELSACPNGVPDAGFTRRMLMQSRSAHPTSIQARAAGITDVRFYRITVELGTIGIHLALLIHPK